MTNISTNSKNRELEDDKIDFYLLKKHSSSSSNSSSSETSNDNWPLFLNVHFVDHFIFGDEIGRGSYALVRECVDTRNLERCAVKIVDKNYLQRQAPSALRNQLEEIKLLKRIKHTNIISLKECLYKGPKIYIVLEYCSFVLSGLLAEKKDNRLCSTLARNLFHQLCSGLCYLHSNYIVHLDVKPQNILITTCGTLKLIDFGVSQKLDIWANNDLCSNYEGSPLFQAPEIISAQALQYSGFKVDVWSAGVTLYLMIYGQYPFFDDTLLGLYDKILSEDLQIKQDKSIPCQDVLNDLIVSMLDKVSERRASVKEIFEHPWMKIDFTVQFQGHSEFIEPKQTNFENDNQDTDNNHKIRDIYRSMTVLPYLYNHHFPSLPVMKVKVKLDQKNEFNSTGTSVSPPPSASISPIAPSDTRPSSANSEASNLSHCSSALNNNDPHEIIEDRPIEWGTERQYKLLKVPHVRANRIKYNLWRRERRKGR